MTTKRRFIPVSRKPFVWLDTETTGLDPDKNEVLSIAIVRPKDDGSEIVYERKLKMERPENAHPKALEVNGYTDEAWADAMPQEACWREIADLQLLSECIVAGQNVRFDAGFLNASFKRHGINYRMDYHLYDTVTVALLVLKPYVSSVSLASTAVALGIPVVEAHTALGDVRLCQQVDSHCREILNNGEHLHSHFGPQVLERIAAWKDAGRPNTWTP